MCACKSACVFVQVQVRVLNLVICAGDAIVDRDKDDGTRKEGSLNR